MARRSSGSLLARLIPALLLAGCTVGGANPEAPSSTTLVRSSPSSTTSTTPSTTTTAWTVTTTPPETPDIDAEVGVPDGEGPFPAVVLVHGGGWVAGSPALMRPMARAFNDAGFLTVNTRYHLASLERPGFPEAIEDVACAVRYAASLPDSDGTVTVVGHSAGAHIGAVVALTGDDYVGDCPLGGTGLPNRFVGLAGPYDVARLGPALVVFFGEGPTVAPEAWQAGNPQLLIDRNPALRSLIMYGELDGFVEDSFAFDFHNALLDSGATSDLELVEGARHNDLVDPDLVGDLIVTWLER